MTSISPSSVSTGPTATSLAPTANGTSELRAAAEAFEAIFLRQLLASARSADFGGEDLFGGPGLEQFEAMRDEHFADIASSQSMFGLADAIERQLSAFVQPATSQPETTD